MVAERVSIRSTDIMGYRWGWGYTILNMSWRHNQHRGAGDTEMHENTRSWAESTVPFQFQKVHSESSSVLKLGDERHRDF
jgi:hypothetical protein